MMSKKHEPKKHRRMGNCFQRPTEKEYLIQTDPFLQYLLEFDRETDKLYGREKRTKMFVGAVHVYPKILYIFQQFIDASDLDERRTRDRLEYLYSIPISASLRSCIIAQWIFLLNKQDTPDSFAIKQIIVERQLNRY